MLDFKRFRKFKENIEIYRKSGEFPYHPRPLKEDMDFLKKSRREAFIYPAIFSGIFTPFFYIMVHRASFPLLFQNPIKDTKPAFHVQVKRFKNHFAWTVIIGSCMISLFAGQIRDKLTHYFMYLEYKNLVDRYVVLRDEKTLQDAIVENRKRNFK